MNTFPRFCKGASPGRRDGNTNAHGVDLDSGHVDYNGFPALSRTYCDAGLWPAGEVMSNLNSERNYTYRIPRVKRFHQDYSLPTTATHPNSGPCGKSAHEDLKKHDDIGRKTRPRLTIRNPTPSDGTISTESSRGVGDIPCGGISPYESPGIDDAWGGSLLTVQPVTFGRRSIDIHRAEFSEFLTGRANFDINIRSSSCPSCHLKGRADIIRNPNKCLDVLARPRTGRADHCNQPQAGEIADIPLAHRKVNSGDYTDVFGTFGVRDGFSVPGFCQPRAKNTHPRLEDIFPTTNDRRVTWAADSVAHQGPEPSLPTETETLNLPLSNISSNSLHSRMSSISPDDTVPQREGEEKNQPVGSGPSIETSNIKTHRLSWADNTTIKDCLVPTIVLDKPSTSGMVDPHATTTGRYVFKLGSLKIGIGFAPNARAKSPYPRALNNTPLDECRSAVIEEPNPKSKWATFSMHSRRAYPYLMKARSSVSLRRTCVSPASTEGPRQSPLAAADPIEISVESFRGRSRYNTVSNLSMIDEFRRKNDLLAMESGYRIPERMESPTRSEKIELYGEDLVNSDFICRARRKLRKVFKVSGHTR